MKPLNPLDAGFLTGETRQMPMHVGALLLFRPPPGAGPGFLGSLCEEIVSVDRFRAPFDQKLAYPPARLGLPHWVTDPQFDLEYHVRHSALPKPGRYRELFVLVSRLHGTLLDRTRPLWEYHVIEGLETGQFALYSKFHHAVLDGMAGMRLLQRSLSEDPGARDILPPWSADAGRARSGRSRGKQSADLVQLIKDEVESVPGVLRALGKTAALFKKPADTRMALPFEAPRSALNTRITGARRFVAQSYSLERIHRVRKVFGATVNDVVLALCSSALRRYLLAFAGGVPERPLIAMTPVSVRPSDGDDFGNAVSAILVNLGTHIEDPARRMEVIRASVQDGKDLLGALTFREVMLYTMLISAPAMTPTVLGFAQHRPAFNVIISNVPGPKQPLYWNGARLDGMYPVSIVVHGMALNITVSSYVDSLDFGIAACRRSMPQVQRFIDYLEEALGELEAAAGVK